jgi:hypothetical protein
MKFWYTLLFIAIVFIILFSLTNNRENFDSIMDLFNNGFVQNQIMNKLQNKLRQLQTALVLTPEETNVLMNKVSKMLQILTPAERSAINVLVNSNLINRIDNILTPEERSAINILLTDAPPVMPVVPVIPVVPPPLVNWAGKPFSTDGRCGPSYGDTSCAVGCCSAFGWCGEGVELCQTFNQSNGIYDRNPKA